MCEMNLSLFQIMPSVDQYSKRYVTKRRAAPQDDSYHLFIFASDNSFSIVKSKQCTAAEHDGIVMVQSGGQKYSGFIVQTGTCTIDKYFALTSLDFPLIFRFVGCMQ